MGLFLFDEATPGVAYSDPRFRLLVIAPFRSAINFRRFGIRRSPKISKLITSAN